MQPDIIIEFTKPGTLETVGKFLWGAGAALVTWITTSTDESGQIAPENLNPFRKWSEQEARDIRRASKVLQEIRLQQHGRLGDIATNKNVPQYIKDSINSPAMQYVVEHFKKLDAGTLRFVDAPVVLGFDDDNENKQAKAGAAGAGDAKQAVRDPREEYKQVVADPDEGTAADNKTAAGGLGFTTPWSAQQKKDIERARADLQKIRKEHGDLGDIAKNPRVPQYIKDGINSAAMQYVVDYFKQKEARSQRGKAQQKAGAGAGAAGAPKDPKENKDDDDGPDDDDEIEYEASGKHHDNAKPDVSPAPLFPHESLRRSIPIPDSAQRISLCKSGEWVDIFLLTLGASGKRKATYHGYRILLKVARRDDLLKNVLKEAKLIQ